MAVDVRTAVATSDDAEDLVPRMRAVEVEEVRAATGREPLPVLLEGLRDSAEAWSVFFDGELAFMWGVVPLGGYLGGAGLGWLLTTDMVERHAKTFWQYTRAVMPQLLARWDVLANAIDVRHEKAIRWATRLGFHLDAPVPVVPGGPPFRVFRASREDVACALR